MIGQIMNRVIAQNEHLLQAQSNTKYLDDHGNLCKIGSSNVEPIQIIT